MKFIDFFSGAGMFRKGLENAGHECIGYCEIDKFARKTYENNFNTEGEWTAHDIQSVKGYELPKANIWSAGFPCQNLSVANACSRYGLDGDKSGLFFDIIRLLKEVDQKPKYLFLENVRGLVTINKGKDFLIVLKELYDVGYETYFEVSSANDYNVPQNRIRTYIVCKLNENQGSESGNEIPNRKTIKVDGININELYEYINNKDEKIKLDYGKCGRIVNGILYNQSFIK